MKKIFSILMMALMIFTLTGCGEVAEDKTAEPAKESPATAPTKKVLVAYFSCTGTTKTLAENAAEVLQADLYEIKPEVPYTEKDLNWRDETTRATVEQRDESSRPALADKNAPVAQYETIVIAFPIWWGIAPRIIDTFVESYDFSNKKIIPICTSGGSEVGASADYLKSLASDSATWFDGKSFFKNGTKDDLKNYFDSLGL